MNHSTGKKFFNPWPNAEPHGLLGVLRWSFERIGRNRAGGEAPGLTFPTGSSVTAHLQPDQLSVTWIGHSSFLIQTGELNLLTDPIWSQRASPLRFAGPKRISQPGISLDGLPPIHGVLVSHDHYDHLDSSTVRELVRRHPEARWFAPLGVGKWLAKRGVKHFGEHDWDQTVTWKGARVTCIPAQHFSGRTLTSRDSTLWCGWIVRAGERALLFAGDTGLHPEFERLRKVYGPFNIAIMPIGAYDPRWFMRPVHMNPQDAVTAYQSLAAVDAHNRCVFIPAHWGTFVLTDEPVTEPPELLFKAWNDAGLPAKNCALLRPGETFSYLP